MTLNYSAIWIVSGKKQDYITAHKWHDFLPIMIQSDKSYPDLLGNW